VVTLFMVQALKNISKKTKNVKRISRYTIKTCRKWGKGSDVDDKKDYTMNPSGDSRGGCRAVA